MCSFWDKSAAADHASATGPKYSPAKGSWRPELAAKLADLVDATDRDNDPLGEAEQEPASAE